MELSLLIIKKFDCMNSNTILQRETILFLQGHYIFKKSNISIGTKIQITEWSNL